VKTIRRTARRWEAVLVPYLLGAGLTVAAVTLRLSLDPLLGDRARFLLPLAAVCVVAILAGPGPAVTALVITVALAVLFLVPLPLSLPDAINAAAFLLIALVVIVLAERLRISLMAASRSAVEAHTSAATAAQQASDLHAVLEVFPDAVVLFDAQGHQRLANPAAVALVGGLPLDQVLGRLNLTASPLDQQVETKDRRSGRWLEVSSHRVGPGRAGGEVLVMRDVTLVRERRLREEAFGAMLSHELRTPLTIISGNARVIRRNGGLDKPTQAELLAGIDAESDRMRRLVDDLLVLARGPRSEDVPPEPLILRRIVEAVVREEVARRPEARLLVDLPADLPLVAGDAGNIEHVLRSLLGNAAKHAPDRPVRISGTATGERVTLHVADGGLGIEAGDEERIFELFYRSPRADATPGSGIGLYVSRALVESMGGRLRARQAREGGAELLIELPAYDEAGAMDLDDQMI
jgi:K+-sensing histidine kinase KdpD